ncbi:hypothetical protein EVU94_14045, partial [Flavobacteriaceae bacterium 144Ye]
MKKNTFLIVLLITVIQFGFSQEKYSRVKIINPSEQTIKKIASEGIDLKCGSKHDHDDLIIEVSETEINKLDNNGISYRIEIDDLEKFYSERAIKDLRKAKAELQAEKARSLLANSSQNRSISSVVHDNIIQYAECDEVDWATPQNYNLGSMSGCLTFNEMKAELDDMYTYSQNNGLDIVSQKANASSTGQKTWGNPTNNFVNQQNNGPATYSGVGSTRWNPETIWYIRITGNQSISPEGSKPQMLFTSMIHSREVSALMNNMFFMWYIIENYNTDDAIKELVDNNELYFVPVVNPDGLRWNETLSPSGGGMQRKNLRPNTGGTGTNRGVDLNRNFDYFWGYNNIGSSGNASSGTYRGPFPESEPETQIMVDFITSRNFKSAVWNHSYANSVPHPYGGVPTASSGREDEYYKWHEEMTRYNRYLYGATIFYESNGLPDDWMMGGSPDNNGSTGSEQAIIATTPEHGGQGFWPTTTTITPIAKQSMRISMATAYYGGKYAKLHDLTQSNITSTTANLDFGIERIGQTASDFTITVTPISSNILSVSSPVTETGMPVLSQKTVTFNLDLDPSITANEVIAYNVALSNDDGIIYSANYEKYYQPNLLFDHNPDSNGLTGWTQAGGWINTTSDAYSASNSISTGTYSNNATKTLTTTNSYDFSSSQEVIIQFYSKWDIERNYDFVEILASPNGGSSWVPLCGNYTKPNASNATTSHDNKSSTYANFQNNSSGQIYDGDRMDNWVMEEIVIDGAYPSLLSSNDVKIRFNFRTDGLNVNENYSTTNDGFFIDDFKIISVNVPCQTTTPTGITVSNITPVTAQVTWNQVPSATYDLRYREVGAPSWTEITDIATNNYLISGLETSTNYEVQIATRCTSATSPYSTSENFTTTDPVPCTGTAVISYPYSENWNTDIGDWTQGTGDNGEWTLNTGTTASTGTGPNNDYSGSGNYFYTEASTNGLGFNATVYLISPCFDFTNHINPEFTFYYHMFGADMGSLSVDITLDDGNNWSTLTTISGQQQGSNGAAWLQEIVDLSDYEGLVVKLRFTGITGSDFTSDIAIDQINLTADEAGSAPPTAICQNISIQLDQTGNASILASDIDNGSNDDIAITNYSIDIDTFDCSNVGTPVDVTLTVTDGDGQTDSCIATVTVNRQDEPTAVNCWDNFVYNDTTCMWENQGSQDPEPATECWETATFNDTTCSWDVTGTQPAEPATECWETATFNDTTCSWDVTGTQPAEPTTECWETATFNDTTCSWDVTGTQPAEPATECWETATFNDTTCSWD